jgi:hypothetical protein
LNHRERHDGSGENRENQPTRDAPIPIPQLPNVRRKVRRGTGLVRALFPGGVKLSYFSRFWQKLGNSIRILACHGADFSIGNSGSHDRKRRRALTAIVISGR